MPKLVVTVKDKVVMPRVRLAIRQLVGVERVFTLREISVPITTKKGQLHNKLVQRINSLSQLSDGWDGENSKAISVQCIKKLQRVLDKTDENLLNGWVLFPDANGYLYFDYSGDNCTADITMMPDKMVYFIERNGRLQKSDGVRFTSTNLISILKRVNG